MEQQAMATEINAGVISPERILSNWQGHRNLTRKVIEAFPEKELFNFSVGGMRPFAELAREIMGLTEAGLQGIVTGDWSLAPEMDYHIGNYKIGSKAELLALWDRVTEKVEFYWPQIPAERYHDIVLAFGAYEGDVSSTIQYGIDNEIHHRAQGYVYLRALGIEPPGFWDRSK